MTSQYSFIFLIIRIVIGATVIPPAAKRALNDVSGNMVHLVRFMVQKEIMVKFTFIAQDKYARMPMICISKVFIFNKLTNPRACSASF